MKKGVAAARGTPREFTTITVTDGIAMGMPANKTQSAIRDHAGNEILMEGKGGSEDIRITAVKDMNVTVTHDYNEIVKTGNRTIAINIMSALSPVLTDGDPEIDLAPTVAFLCSDACRYLTGQTLTLDGGVYAFA